MSTIITVNSLEQNVGVSSTVLTLSEKLNYYTKKKTCIVELDYNNPTFSYILENDSIGKKNIDNIFAFIKKDTVIDENLYNLLKFNVQAFKNSNIDILYGSKKGSEFSNHQLNLLISALREVYEIIIIDYGNKILPSVILDNSDMNICLVQASNRYINKLKLNRRDYITKKTSLLVNNAAKGNSYMNLVINDIFEDIQLLGQLPTSDKLIRNLLKGTINIEKGDYNEKITQVALKIIKFLSMEIKIKNTFTEKLLRKENSREEDIYIEQYDEYSLEKILLDNNLCTKDNLEKGLSIQNKKIDRRS